MKGGTCSKRSSCPRSASVNVDFEMEALPIATQSDASDQGLAVSHVQEAFTRRTFGQTGQGIWSLEEGSVDYEQTTKRNTEPDA